MQLAVLTLTIAAAATSSAATYWINASKTASANCGTTAGNACPDYAHLMGSAGCPSACGCDANGCLDNINAVTGPVTINFVSGTYHGDGNGHMIGAGFARSAGRDLTLQPTDATGAYVPGISTVDGIGVTIQSQYALITVDGDPSGTNDASTSFVWVRGFNVRKPVAGAPAVRVRGRASHWSVRDLDIDCTGTGDVDCTVWGPQSNFGTLVNNKVYNCGNGAWGCFGHSEQDNEALVGNVLGPNIHGYQPYPANNDVLTIQNGARVLIDGNLMRGPQTNCLDIGQTTDVTHPLHSIIVRYNDAVDCGNTRGVGDWTSPNIKVSGDAPSNTPSYDIAIYKNLSRFTSTANRNGGIWTTELTKDTDLWYNTVWDVIHDATDGSRMTWGPQANSASSNNIPSFYNLWDSSDAVGCSVGHACTVAASGSGCTSALCKFVGNGWYFPNLGATAGLIGWSTSDLGSLQFNPDLSRVGGGADFNHAGSNRGNFRADPHFANRGGTRIADFSLTSASAGYLDAGDAFCHAAAAGTGNMITVTCSGSSTDPRHYFPQPSDYYALANGDCAGRGVRTAEANGSVIGCFDIQIEGCGGSGGLGNLPNVRTVTAATSTTITFSGGSCSWASGAKVHVPWNGSAPDVGALEFGTQGLPAPTLIDVQPVG